MLVWACTENGENRIPKKVLYMKLKATRLRGRPRNRWQDEVREDGTLAGRKGWKERVYNREEWKKLLRMARNHCILHVPMEGLNESTSAQSLQKTPSQTGSCQGYITTLFQGKTKDLA